MRSGAKWKQRESSLHRVALEKVVRSLPLRLRPTRYGTIVIVRLGEGLSGGVQPGAGLPVFRPTRYGTIVRLSEGLSGGVQPGAGLRFQTHPVWNYSAAR